MSAVEKTFKEKFPTFPFRWTTFKKKLSVVVKLSTFTTFHFSSCLSVGLVQCPPSGLFLVPSPWWCLTACFTPANMSPIAMSLISYVWRHSKGGLVLWVQTPMVCFQVSVYEETKKTKTMRNKSPALILHQTRATKHNTPTMVGTEEYLNNSSYNLTLFWALLKPWRILKICFFFLLQSSHLRKDYD